MFKMSEAIGWIGNVACFRICGGIYLVDGSGNKLFIADV